MTNPINLFGRVAQSDPSSRASGVNGDKAKAEAAGAASAKAAPAGAGDDQLQLSEVAREAMREPEFDRAKVEAIKTALQQGQYPLDSRRIAESFVAIERMIKN